MDELTLQDFTMLFNQIKAAASRGQLCAMSFDQEVEGVQTRMNVVMTTKEGLNKAREIWRIIAGRRVDIDHSTTPPEIVEQQRMGAVLLVQFGKNAPEIMQPDFEITSIPSDFVPGMLDDAFFQMSMNPSI